MIDNTLVNEIAHEASSSTAAYGQAPTQSLERARAVRNDGSRFATPESVQVRVDDARMRLGRATMQCDALRALKDFDRVVADEDVELSANEADGTLQRTVSTSTIRLWTERDTCGD